MIFGRIQRLLESFFFLFPDQIIELLLITSVMGYWMLTTILKPSGTTRRARNSQTTCKDASKVMDWDACARESLAFLLQSQPVGLLYSCYTLVLSSIILMVLETASRKPPVG